MPSNKDSDVTDEEVEALLAEEREMRAKQPEGWAKTKYRKYANYGCKQRKTDDLIKAATKPNTKEKIYISKEDD